MVPIAWLEYSYAIYQRFFLKLFYWSAGVLENWCEGRNNHYSNTPILQFLWAIYNKKAGIIEIKILLDSIT